MSSITDIIEFISTEFSDIGDIANEWTSSSAEGTYNDFATNSSIVTLPFCEDNRATVRLRQLFNKLAVFEVECDDSGIFNAMTKVGVSGKHLCVLLWYSIESALAKNSTFELVERGVLAACAYLQLASIKGSEAYAIFNPHLYQKCLILFRYLYRCLTYSRTTAKSKGKGIQKKRQDNVEYDMETEENRCLAAAFDKDEIKHLLEESTEALFVLLNKVSLSGYSGTTHESALLVRDLASIDVHADAKVEVASDLQEFRKLHTFCDRSFALMHRLIDERHSARGYIVISRIVYPRLAFWTFDCCVVPSSSTIPAVFTVWRDLMVKFIKVRVEAGHVAELMTILKTLDNLYLRCTDRLDYRTRQAQSVLNVLQVLPRVFQYDYVQRIDRFSRIQRISVRNFTSEIVPLVLTNFDFHDPEPGFYDAIDNAYRNATQTSNTPSSSNGFTRDEDHLVNTFEEAIENLDSRSYSGSEDESNADGNKKRKSALSKKTTTQNVILERVPILPALYTCVIRCCLDKASSVRIRAMLHLASLLSAPEYADRLIYYANKMFEDSPKIFVGGFTENEESSEYEAEEKVNEDAFLDDSEIVIDNVMLHIILTRAADDTAGVRKNSLLALQVFFPYIIVSSQVEDAVECLKERCLDSSLMVRKQAAEVLDHLFCSTTRHWSKLKKGWLSAVLPMINDREQSVQQLVAQIITETVFNPLLGEMGDNSWNLLRSIELENNYRRLLIRALMQEHREGHIKSVLVEVLNKKLDIFPDQSDVIWMLLADLSVIFKVKPEKAVRAWYSLENGDTNNRVRYVTKVLAKNCADIDDNTKKDLICDFRTKLINFRIHAPNISSIYYCFAKMLDAVGEEAKGQKLLCSFGKEVLVYCRTRIREILLEIEEEQSAHKLSDRETLLIRMVTTIGEVVQFSSQLMKSGLRLLDALKTVLASDLYNATELSIINSAMPSVNPTPVTSRAPSPVMSLMSMEGGPFQPTSRSQPISSQGGAVIPQHIVQNAINGRRALLTPSDEKIAKATIPVFVKQLKLNPDHVIRNNIALVVCDLCVRYTLMVDRYTPIIAACLKDRSTLVRQQTLESLTSLIKEQFIRWEGQIMYRFVSAILDENRMISEYAKFCLRDVLLLQFPDLFESHFIECLTYFNNVPLNCEKGAAHERKDRSQQVCLHGDNNQENRMTIYKFMLSTFDDTRKFALMVHICTQIFCPLMNGKFRYEDPNVFALVRDSLLIMSLKEIKLNMDVGKGPDEEEEPPAALIAVAKEIVTKAFRKAMLEHVMPTLLDLRVYLNEKRSALRKDLYAIFRIICREHKEQMDEFLDGDEQLKSEVEYDICRYEAHEKAQRAAIKKRAERAATERRLSRRSLAVTSQIINESNVNGTWKNTSVAKEEDYEQEAAVHGTEHSVATTVVPVEVDNVANVSAAPQCIVVGTTTKHPISADQSYDAVLERRLLIDEETCAVISHGSSGPLSTTSDTLEVPGSKTVKTDAEGCVVDHQSIDTSDSDVVTKRNSREPESTKSKTDQGRFTEEAEKRVTSTIIGATMGQFIVENVVTDPESRPMDLETMRSSKVSILEKENFREPGENLKRGTAQVAVIQSDSHLYMCAKRSKYSASCCSNDNPICVRAASTPIREMSELRFADLNLSAIPSHSDESIRSFKRRRAYAKDASNSSSHLSS